MEDPRVALAALRAASVGAVSTEPDRLERFSRDASPIRGAPIAAVAPPDEEAVVRLVAWARRFRTPLVARGGGSSLDGESVGPEGAVVVDFSGWDQILELLPAERLARVGPGVVNYALQQTVEPIGLFFPPNPGSWTTCTVGGNAATNASGPRSFRYGPTRAWIAAARVVLGTGERITLGTRAPKRSVGPELLGALIGSEGTLGLITELTVRLAPLPERRVGLVAPIRDGHGPAELVSPLVPSPPDGLSAVEFIDGPTSEALAREDGSRIPSGQPLLLLEIEGSATEIDGRLERVLELLRGTRAVDDPVVYPEANRLWTMRGRSGVALDRTLGPRVREDVAVPVPRIGELLDAIGAISRSHGVPVYVYGHLGEGSLHPNFAVAPEDPRAERIRRDLLERSLALGGTISGEHGVGRLKAPYLPLEVGDVGLRLLLGLKALCDPDGILNPGDVLSPRRRREAGSPSGSPSGGGAARTPPG